MFLSTWFGRTNRLPPHCYLGSADRRRLEGNLQFRGGDGAAAAVLYRMALSFLDEDLLMQLEAPHLEKVSLTALKVIINLHSSFTGCIS